MFDNVCKFLVETFPSDFARWLLGESIELTELSPAELSLEPIRADALILLQSEQVVLHLEFQTRPKADIPFRMIDYRLRVHRRFPQKQMRQVVIYLQFSNSAQVRQTSFALERTQHEFDVIRLWEEPTDFFLRTPALLPFAVLSQTSNRAQVLQQVAQSLRTLSDSRAQSNLTASTFILAGLVLEVDVIQQLLRRDIMEESVTYQLLRQEARTEGLAEGRAEGRAEGLTLGQIAERRRVALNLLSEGIPLEVIARVTGLSFEQIQQLPEGDRQAEL